MEFKNFGITDKNELHEYKNSEKAFNDNCSHVIQTNNFQSIDFSPVELIFKVFHKFEQTIEKDTIVFKNI